MPLHKVQTIKSVGNGVHSEVKCEKRKENSQGRNERNVQTHLEAVGGLPGVMEIIPGMQHTEMTGDKHRHKAANQQTWDYGPL